MSNAIDILRYPTSRENGTFILGVGIHGVERKQFWSLGLDIMWPRLAVSLFLASRVTQQNRTWFCHCLHSKGTSTIALLFG